ncbi:MAG: hypothetical protein A2189_00835 [Paenibacillus sp. RIFOXYA1_FULL_44_5]|nr:MAG: hypothetical protein A2189_00835 [Paenibacillus sp. RIFOXYA1_FULL_44_5]
MNLMIEQLCVSKAEEFRMIGYDNVTGKEIWDFVSEQYMKTGYPALHRMVNDILTLKVNQYMNWLTLSAYKGTNFFAPKKNES